MSRPTQKAAVESLYSWTIDGAEHIRELCFQLEGYLLEPEDTDDEEAWGAMHDALEYVVGIEPAALDMVTAYRALVGNFEHIHALHTDDEPKHRKGVRNRERE